MEKEEEFDENDPEIGKQKYAFSELEWVGLLTDNAALMWMIK